MRLVPGTLIKVWDGYSSTDDSSLWSVQLIVCIDNTLYGNRRIRALSTDSRLNTISVLDVMEVLRQPEDRQR